MSETLAGNIVIDVDALRDGKVSLEEKLTVFSTYSAEYLEDIRSKLAPFNSDFITEIRKVLNNMKDTNAPKLIEALQKYTQQLELLADSFTQLENEISEQLNTRE